MRNMLLVLAMAAVLVPGAAAQSKSPAAQAFDRLKALEGEWIDPEGVFGGPKGAVAVTYKVTAGGHTVVETFPINTPHEMVTVYHLDGDQLVLTHYCSSNNQPRMRSSGLRGNVVEFQFAGGANIDPATTSHMHGVRMEFVSPNELRSTWENWKDGKGDHGITFRVMRKQ
jgi:hypothetical protein